MDRYWLPFRRFWCDGMHYFTRGDRKLITNGCVFVPARSRAWISFAVTAWYPLFAGFTIVLSSFVFAATTRVNYWRLYICSSFLRINEQRNRRLHLHLYILSFVFKIYWKSYSGFYFESYLFQTIFTFGTLSKIEAAGTFSTAPAGDRLKFSLRTSAVLFQKRYFLASRIYYKIMFTFAGSSPH